MVFVRKTHIGFETGRFYMNLSRPRISLPIYPLYIKTGYEIRVHYLLFLSLLPHSSLHRLSDLPHFPQLFLFLSHSSSSFLPSFSYVRCFFLCSSPILSTSSSEINLSLHRLALYLCSSPDQVFFILIIRFFFYIFVFLSLIQET